MLRVVIADDEARICKLIEILADWKALDMAVAGIAENGPDALELVRAKRPDILITDIRMPGCDGLELIRRAKRLAPALEVVIISGYAQFDYAQTAIQYGVGDYLLKPINKEALHHTLEKMGERCRARAQSDEAMQRLRSARDDPGRPRDSLIGDLLHNRCTARTQKALTESYQFGGLADTYQIFLLKMDYEPARFTDDSMAIVWEKADDLFRPVLTAACCDFLLGFEGAMMIGVLHYDTEQRGILRMHLRECLNQLIAQKGLFGAVEFSMALGLAVSSPAALAESVENAGQVLAERLLEGTGHLLEGMVSASSLREMNLLARYTRDASRAIDVLSHEEADRAADALRQGALSVPNARGWELLELVRAAGVIFITRLDGEGRAEALAAFETSCAQCASASGLFECLQSMQRAALESARARQRSQQGQPIRIAKQYIQKHYAQPLTLEEVSAASGFSVNYFSTLFKKETGEGFSKYLSRVRVDAAKGLLRETRLPVAEICKRVGYVDLKHFTRTFRAEAGITPGEFRKLYG